MIPYKIGNWLINADGIRWDGIPKVDYLITQQRLLELGPPPERANMYDWLVHLPEKTWLTEADVYTLNTAFIYALAHFGLNFNTGSFVETLIEQQRQLEIKRS